MRQKSGGKISSTLRGFSCSWLAFRRRIVIRRLSDFRPKEKWPASGFQAAKSSKSLLDLHACGRACRKGSILVLISATPLRFSVFGQVLPVIGAFATGSPSAFSSIHEFCIFTSIMEWRNLLTTC